MNYLVCVMFYFQFFGMFNLSIHRDPGRERLLFYWTWIHLAGLATLTFIIIHFAGKIFFIVDTLGTVADVIQVAAPLLTHYIIIVESLCTRRIRLKILDRMAEVDKLYPSLIIARAKQIQIRRYFNKLVVTQALCIFFELCIMHGISGNELWTRHWYVSIYVFNICRSQHLFYVYYVDLVKCRLDVVAGELKNVGSLLHSDDVCVSTVKLYGQIKQAKKAYSSIWEMVQFIEMAFGWSMFSNIISNFICLTVNLYWNYASLLYIKSNIFWKESVMCSFPLIITFYVLFSSCDSCIQTVSLRMAHNNRTWAQTN